MKHLAKEELIVRVRHLVLVASVRIRVECGDLVDNKHHNVAGIETDKPDESLRAVSQSISQYDYSDPSSENREEDISWMAGVSPV